VTDRKKWKDLVRQAKAHSGLKCQWKKKNIQTNYFWLYEVSSYIVMLVPLCLHTSAKEARKESEKVSATDCNHSPLKFLCLTNKFRTFHVFSRS
jgi:hypothetical protein